MEELITNSGLKLLLSQKKDGLGIAVGGRIHSIRENSRKIYRKDWSVCLEKIILTSGMTKEISRSVGGSRRTTRRWEKNKNHSVKVP